MKRRVAYPLIGLAALLFLAAGRLSASSQAHERVYWLGTDDGQLCEENGRAFLGKGHWPPVDQFPRWYVSAPTIRSASGKFLASDPAGRDPTVRLVGEKGPNTRWTFEFVSRMAPRQTIYCGKSFWKGTRGFTFRMKAAEGPFRDWYLAVAQDPGKREGAETGLRPLRLVRGVKEATVFTYIEENYDIK